MDKSLVSNGSGDGKKIDQAKQKNNEVKKVEWC